MPLDLTILDGDKIKHPEVAEPRVQLIGYSMFVDAEHADEEGGNPQFRRDSKAPGYGGGHHLIEFAGRTCYRSWNRPNPKTATNEGYIANILDHKHLSVLRHAQVTFYITGVSRRFSHEMVTHAHLARSQESQRYVPANEIRYVVPAALRNILRREDGTYPPNEFSEMVRLARNSYEKLSKVFTEGVGLKGKKSRETAAHILPNCVETRMTVSANYQGWLEWLTKRHSPHADAEMQAIADMIYWELVGLAPQVFGPDARDIWDPEFRKQYRGFGVTPHVKPGDLPLWSEFT